MATKAELAEKVKQLEAQLAKLRGSEVRPYLEEIECTYARLQFADRVDFTGRSRIGELTDHGEDEEFEWEGQEWFRFVRAADITTIAIPVLNNKCPPILKSDDMLLVRTKGYEDFEADFYYVSELEDEWEGIEAVVVVRHAEV